MLSPAERKLRARAAAYALHARSQETYDPNALGAGIGATDFARNQVRARFELRAQVAWTRPAGFVIATLA